MSAVHLHVVELEGDGERELYSQSEHRIGCPVQVATGYIECSVVSTHIAADGFSTHI